MISPTMALERARKPGWKEALRARFMRDFDNEGLWRELEQAYSAPGRHYHTLAHLAHLFALYDGLGNRIHWQSAVRSALWFHDWTYEASPEKYPKNEHQSAEAFHAAAERQPRQCTGELPLSDLFHRALAEQLILATQRHAIDAEIFARQPAARADCELFLDMDLAIFACSPAEVQAYDRAVRAEFGDYPDAQFAAGRLAALKAFLARERLFLSPTFSPWEAKARENLQMLVTQCVKAVSQ